jgi:hypothetical protein
MNEVMAAFAIVGVLFVCEWAVAAWHRNIEAAVMLRDSFFTAAETLVSDPETPDSIIALLDACADTITRVEVGRLVIRRALANRLPNAAITDEDDEESDRFLRDVHGMREDLRKTLASAAMQYAQAVSFNNMLLGTFVRRWSATWLAGPSRGSTQSAERLMIDVTPKLLGQVRAAAANG